MENLISLPSLDQIEVDDVNSRLAAIVDSSNDAIISKNLKGVISTWNRAAERLLGYSEAEAVGKPITILIPSELLEEEAEILKRVRLGEHIEHYETRRISSEGRTLDVSISVSPIRNQQGTIIGASKILRDITEAKRVQEALRESERRLAHEVAGARALHSISTRLISELTEESLFSQLLDAAMELMCSNAASIQMLTEDGTSLALLGWKHFHPASATFWERVTADAGSTCGVALRDNVRVLVSDVETCEFMGGTEDLEEYRRSGIRAVQSTPLQSRTGVPVGMISTHWHAPHTPTEDDFRLFDVLARQAADLIERVRTENAIRESEERFRLIANTVPVGIWMSDTSKGWVFINQTALEFTGQSIDASLGNRWMARIHQEDVMQVWEIYSQAFDRRERFQAEFRLSRCDCEYRWVIYTGAPRYHRDGSFAGYIGSYSDITERKESERVIREANDELNRLKNQLEAENIYLQDELLLEQTLGELVGQSDVMKYLSHKISQVAPTDATVLILGETGTGKELAARAIHEASSRRDRSLIKVNCAALSPSLIESELFGHEKGAFTGAGTRKVGRFELANGGSILLDEIGELPLDLQVKLLRVLQENEFERVGGGQTIKVDVRVIAATNRNLREEVDKRRFREDLWYRLNVFPITTPPLRDRLDDIPVLVEHFVKRLNRKLGRQITSVSATSMKTLGEYSWPGNVRELGNVIERAVINSKGSVLRIHDDFQSFGVSAPVQNIKTLEEVERDHIMRVLEERHWRIEGPNAAAQLLGMNPSTLRTRMIKLGIHRQGSRIATSANLDA